MPLTDTQQMTYLQRALIGDTKRAIRGMLNHGNLYKNALLKLEEQFGNRDYCQSLPADNLQSPLSY